MLRLFTLFLISCTLLYSQELSITDGELDFEDNQIEEDYEVEKDKLSNSKVYSTQNWIDLEVKYTAIWDQELNSFYQRLLTSLDSDQKELLMKSQRAWLNNYNSKSELLYNLLAENRLNGSGGYMLFYTKLLNEKKKRVYELMEYCYILAIDYNIIYK